MANQSTSKKLDFQTAISASIKTNSPIQSEIAMVAQREMFRRSFATINLSQLDGILNSIRGGRFDQMYQWFDFMCAGTMPRIPTLVARRADGLMSRDIQILPANETPEAIAAADFIREQFDKIENLNDAIRQLLRAVFSGLELAELKWEFDPQTNTNYVCSIDHIAGTKLQYDFSSDNPVLQMNTTYANNAFGENFDIESVPNKFIIHRPMVTGQYVAYSGLFQVLSRYFLITEIILRFGLSALERWADPMVYASVDSTKSIPPSQRHVILNAMNKMSGDSRLVLDDSVKLNVLESSVANAGDNSSVMAFLNWIQTEMTIAVLGANTNTEIKTDSANRSTAEVHQQNTIQIWQMDAKAICQTLKYSLVKPLLEYNVHKFNGQMPPLPKLFIDVQVYPEIDELAVKSGAVTKNEIRKKHGLNAWQAERGGNDIIITGQTIATVAAPTPQKATPDAGAPEGLDIGATQDVQTTSLNGAQITSLLDVIKQVATGQIPRSTGVALLTTAFPISPEKAESLMGEVGKQFVPAAPSPFPK